MSEASGEDGSSESGHSYTPGSPEASGRSELAEQSAAPAHSGAMRNRGQRQRLSDAGGGSDESDAEAERGEGDDGDELSALFSTDEATGANADLFDWLGGLDVDPFNIHERQGGLGQGPLCRRSNKCGKPDK